MWPATPPTSPPSPRCASGTTWHCSRLRGRGRVASGGPAGRHLRLDGTYSFQASKLMTAGEGGAVVSPYEDVLASVRSLGDCGRRPGESFYRHFEPRRERPDDRVAGRHAPRELDRFPEQQARRNEHAIWLDDRSPGSRACTRRCGTQDHLAGQLLLRGAPRSGRGGRQQGCRPGGARCRGDAAHPELPAAAPPRSLRPP